MEGLKFDIFSYEKYSKRQRKQLENPTDERAGDGDTHQGSASELVRGRSRVMSMDTIEDGIGSVSTDSLIRTPRLIEGWLWKEADSKKMLQLTKRHIRYVRIVFNSGKFNVKEDKADLQMRSFDLGGLVSFRELTPF